MPTSATRECGVRSWAAGTVQRTGSLHMSRDGRAQVVLGNSNRLQLPRHTSCTFFRIDILPAVRYISQAAVRSVSIWARPFRMLLAAAAVGAACHERLAQLNARVSFGVADGSLMRDR